MKTEHKLALALKEMMCSMPLDAISVTTLTDKVGVNRKTFYYHFHDMYDLLTLVFLDEDIPEASQSKNSVDLVTKIYKYYEKNQSFIDATLNSGAKDIVVEFINNICFKNLLRLINQLEISKSLSLNEKKTIARFYSSGFSDTFIYYVSTHKNKSLNGMFSNFSFLETNTLKEACKTIIKNKK